jgi:hypothetical protein
MWRGPVLSDPKGLPKPGSLCYPSPRQAEFA